MKTDLLLDGPWTLREEGGSEFPIPKMPMQVHDILFFHKQIGSGFLLGHTTDCRWVPERVWIYETRFDCQGNFHQARLLFDGLDTLAEIRLNDELLGQTESCYRSFSFEAQGLRARDNLLQVRFSSVPLWLEQRQEQGTAPDVEVCRYLRKSFHDFTTYLGAKPDFLRVGIFGDVVLELLDEGTLEDFSIETLFSDKLDRVTLTVRIVAEGGTFWRLSVRTPSEETLCFEENCQQEICFTIENPALWWPRGMGEQPLYALSAALYSGDGHLLDRVEKEIGLRKIQWTDCLDFTINKRPLRLWGGNLTPVDGRTLCEDPARVEAVVLLAKQCGMNLLRVWGEGNRFGDTLYRLADREGILLWQEFFCGHAQYPDDRAVSDLILQEARELVLRLRHHPSILLWCGGNECFMSRDFAAPGSPYLAAGLFEREFPTLCAHLDGDRYYLPNSPWGGAYTNDPAKGDTHSYTNSWFVPGGALPGFVSENLRVCFPPVRSLKRYLGLDTLPAPGPLTPDALPWPAVYQSITSADSHKKIPPVEQMYDADTPEGMVYRFGAAAGLYLRDTVEAYRRGKTAADPFGKRQCRGHLVWKLNTSLPHLYSAILDYYLEPCIPYYFLKRAYAPVLASIEYGDQLRIWAVNDTLLPLEGRLVAELFDLQSNAVCNRLERPFFVAADDSTLICTLDAFGQFARDRALRVRLLDSQGQLLAENCGFADIERHIAFPTPTLTLTASGDIITVRTDCYAHCVELWGDDEGDLFGFRFSENYFSLFPDQEKQIRVFGHESALISARAAYCEKTAHCALHKEAAK